MLRRQMSSNLLEQISFLWQLLLALRADKMLLALGVLHIRAEELLEKGRLELSLADLAFKRHTGPER